MNHSILGANRTDYHQTDLQPDTYRGANASKVLLGSFRDNYLDNFGQQTFDYDQQSTEDNWRFLGNDGAFNAPGFTWRDYDGSGQIRSQQTGVAGDGSGGAIMSVGGGSNPYKRQTMYKLWSTGTFERQFKVDQTMIKPYSGDETGLDYSIDIDHSESREVRMQRQVLEHQRSLNAMQLGRKKPDTFQPASDDSRTNMLNKPYSFNGDMDSTAGRQLARHSRTAGLPGGEQPDGMVSKQGMWHDVRERMVSTLKSLRLGVDGDIAYERNNAAPQVIVSGHRNVNDGTFAVDHNERQWSDNLQQRTPYSLGTQQVDLQAQQQLYEGKYAADLYNKVHNNATLETPRAAEFQYDNKKIFERQIANMAIRNLLDAKARDQDIKNDIELEEQRLNVTRMNAPLMEAGAQQAALPSDMDATDERQVAAMLARTWRDPGTAATDTKSDLDVLNERMTSISTHMSAPEFVSLTGLVLGSIPTLSERQNVGAAGADLPDAGSARLPTVASTAFHESRQTPNALAKMSRNAGRAQPTGKLDMDKLDERQTVGQLSRNAPETYLMERNLMEVNNNPTGEVAMRAMHYGANPGKAQTANEGNASGGGKLGQIQRR
jgi:hypothetical protein